MLMINIQHIIGMLMVTAPKHDIAVDDKNMRI